MIIENNVRELSPVYNNQDSYYGKAFIISNRDGGVALKSYDTIVAFLDSDGYLSIRDTYSSTTLRHIKEFMFQNHFTVGTKHDIKECFVYSGCKITCDGVSQEDDVVW